MLGNLEFSVLDINKSKVRGRCQTLEPLVPTVSEFELYANLNVFCLMNKYINVEFLKCNFMINRGQ